MHVTSRHVRRALVLALVLGLPADAGEVELTNGLVLEGSVVPVAGLSESALKPQRGPVASFPMLMVDAGYKRYVFSSSRRRVARVDEAAVLASDVSFDFEHKRIGSNFAVTTLGAVEARDHFDAFGRRTVTVQTPKGPKPIIQGIKRITPKQIEVEGLNVVWEHGLATSSVEPAVLDPILRGRIDPDDPNDRMSIALFYLQADRYPECGRELDAIRERFPELEGRVDEISQRLRQLLARQLLGEIRLRQRAGQHRLAYQAARQFPRKDMAAAVIRQVDELTDEYDQSRMQALQASSLLGRFQSEMEDAEKAAELGPLRTAVKRDLDPESLVKLVPFLNLAEDETLSPEKKLALAYSGWVLGAESAVTDLDAALRYWRARFLLLEYLRGAPERRPGARLEELLGLEGIDLPRLRQMIAELPPIFDTDGITPGVPSRVVVPSTSGDDDELVYHVLLPTEYSPHHRYPMIVALHDGGLTPQAELEWWGVVRKFAGDMPQPGQSQRRGYVVVAPEYLGPDRKYDYGIRTHEIVVDAVRDARKRFRIDSDRVFLSGHGQGGNATFDIAMSRPDLFAGAIPVNGVSDKYCQWYWPNSVHVPMFVVGGELDRDTPAKNAKELTRLVRNYHDVLYCEYVGRGYESFYEEIHVLFDWMDLHRRVKTPDELDLKVLRPSDNRFYWLEAYGLPASVLQSNAALLNANGRGRVVPATLEARFSEANGLDVRRSGASQHVVWLNEDLVDFEQRFTAKVKGRQKFNDFLSPSAETMLEDLRVRGDREKLFTVRLVLD